MNKQSVLLLPNDKARIDNEEGGVNLDFDPNKILSNTKD